MDIEGPRLLRLEGEAGPVRPSKNPLELVSECFTLKGVQGVGEQGWFCVGDRWFCVGVAVRVKFVIFSSRWAYLECLGWNHSPGSQEEDQS